MDKQFLKKITCQSPEDLPYISALVSEGKIKSSELKYLPKNKIFLFLVERLNREKKGFNAAVNYLFDFNNKKFKKYLFSKNPVFDLIPKKYVEELILNNNYGNQQTKFLFNLMNLRLFFEQKGY